MARIQYIATINETPLEYINPYAELRFKPISFKDVQSQSLKKNDEFEEIQSETQFEPQPEITTSPALPEVSIPSISFTPITIGRRGTATYKSGVNVGNMQEVIDKFLDAGMNIKITSGTRKAGEMGKAGNRSHHVAGNAIDIVPGEGESWESLRAKIKGDENLKKWLRDHKIGIIDETVPETMAKTGATGPHWHIGPDQLALREFEKIFAKLGGTLPLIFKNEN